eukprot:jgi/Ulvmu1/3343/UM155_0026.1
MLRALWTCCGSSHASCGWCTWTSKWAWTRATAPSHGTRSTGCCVKCAARPRSTPCTLARMTRHLRSMTGLRSLSISTLSPTAFDSGDGHDSGSEPEGGLTGREFGELQTEFVEALACMRSLEVLKLKGFGGLAAEAGRRLAGSICGLPVLHTLHAVECTFPDDTAEIVEAACAAPQLTRLHLGAVAGGMFDAVVCMQNATASAQRRKVVDAAAPTLPEAHVEQTLLRVSSGDAEVGVSDAAAERGREGPWGEVDGGSLRGACAEVDLGRHESTAARAQAAGPSQPPPLPE